MVDTVKVRLRGELCRAWPAGRWLLLPTAIRFRHDGLGEIKAEASLPKLLFGHNGRLLTTQGELDEAIAKFRAGLLEYVRFEGWEWTLVDLVWQFRAPARAVILAHQWLTFPGIRSLPSLFNGGCQISWKAAQSRLLIRFYDKARASGMGEGILRVEVRLAGGQLRKRLSATARLDFSELWRVFRSELVKFNGVNLPQRKRHSFAEIIGLLPYEFQELALRHYEPGRAARTARAFRRGVSRASLKLLRWNWGEMLPADGPPAAIHVQARRDARSSGGVAFRKRNEAPK